MVLMFAAILFLRYSEYPELENFRGQEYNLEIYDRDGVLIKIKPLTNGLRRIYRPLSEIPDIVEQIFILTEDSSFYLHPGFDPAAVIRALYQNKTSGRIVSGASTISMQLARIISGKTPGYKGKLIEIFNAIRLESRLGKREILELWLNNIPFSFQVEGVPAASLKFLGRDINFLDIESTLVLAVIPRSPASMNPIRNRDSSIKAASDLGVNLGLLDSSELNGIFKYQIPDTPHQWPDITPHFSLYTESILANTFPSNNYPVKIETSISARLNEDLQETINYYISISGDSRITNGAGIIINNRSGEILAYLGSANFNDNSNSGQIDGVQILNQPGSTLKPFLYALGIEMGYRPNSVLPDIPSKFGSTELYQPMNFDGKFHGPVLLRVALASSLNIPAVFMINSVGVDNFTDFLIKIGFKSLIRQREYVGTGLALGNAEVSLFELTRAFSIFPRGGKFLTLTPFKENSGLPDLNNHEKFSLKPYTAGIIQDILSDNNSRYMGFGENNIMDTSFDTMFKTGTSNQFQNIWAIGATPEYTVGIWMGDFSGNTVVGRTGSSLPARIVAEMLELIHTPELQFPEIPNSQAVNLCPLSGLIPNTYTPSIYTEFLPLYEQPEISNWHVSGPDNTVLTVYPADYTVWIEKNKLFGDIATDNSFIEILHPADNSVFFIDSSIPIDDQVLKISCEGFFPGELRVYVNGEYSGKTEDGNYNFILNKGTWNIEFRNAADSDIISFEVL
jgi:penicillin-binding protein 1C